MNTTTNKPNSRPTKSNVAIDFWRKLFTASAADAIFRLSACARRGRRLLARLSQVFKAGSLLPATVEVIGREPAHEILAQRGPVAIKRAITALAAISKAEPKFAPAFASLAQAYSVLPLYSPAAAGDSLRQLALAAAENAVKLDPNLADAYTARALALDALWKWGEGTRDFQKALALDSMNARAHQWYGEHLLIVGNPQQAVRELATATRLDPASPIMAGSFALALVHAGRGKEAVAQAQNAVAMDPSFATTHFMYGAVLLYAGNPKDALIPLGEALELAPDSRTVLGLLGYAQAASGDVALARRTLSRIEQSPRELGSEPAIARIKLAMGDVTGGMQALEKAAKQHDPFFVSEPLSSPPFVSARSDPRFAALTRSVGLQSGTL